MVHCRKRQSTLWRRLHGASWGRECSERYGIAGGKITVGSRYYDGIDYANEANRGLCLQ
jgi:hypothetical protein